MRIPKISIIVPIYNSELYLEQCLNSIINQTFRDIEIICVNDGSTDNSLEILRTFERKDERIKIINRDTSSGSAAIPRNMGLDVARGKYVMLLDSDDYFDLTMLQKLYNRAVQMNADLVMCDCYNISADTGELITQGTELYPEFLPNMEVFSYEDIPNTIFQISNAAVWHKLILRKTIEDNHLRFQQDVAILDDTFFVCSILVLTKRISIIRDRLIYYRKLREGSQTSKIEKNTESFFKSFGALYEYMVEKSIYERVKTSLHNWMLNSMTWWLDNIADIDIYKRVYQRYATECFHEWSIEELPAENIYYDNSRRLYDLIRSGDILFSASVIINSILHEGSKIMIYGAGFSGKEVREKILKDGKHNVVLWCDQNADNLEDSRISNVHAIQPCEFDVVLIAIINPRISSVVKKMLIDMSVDSEKIYEML